MEALGVNRYRFALAISSSASPAAVGLFEQGGKRRWSHVETSHRTGEGLLAATARAMKTEAFDVDIIFVDCGPGQFTGLRAGIGMAQGLAMGWNIPVLPLDSASVMAWAAKQSLQALKVADGRQTDLPLFITVRDARLGSCYLAEFFEIEALPNLPRPLVRELKYQQVVDLVAARLETLEALFIVADERSLSRLAQDTSIRSHDEHRLFCEVSSPAERLDSIAHLGFARLQSSLRLDPGSQAFRAVDTPLRTASAVEAYYVRNEVAMDLAAQRAHKRAQSHAG